MSKNKTCVVCKSKYSYCPSCDARLKSPWLGAFCSENCRDLYTLCVLFKRGEISREEAFVELSELDLSEMEHYSPSTQRILEKILSDD